MSSYGDKLADFLKNICRGDHRDCENCSGGYWKNYSCQHPDHPSMKQTIFTEESLKSPLLKNVTNGMDEFDSYEGKQEAGKFGIKPKRRDDI